METKKKTKTIIAIIAVIALIVTVLAALAPKGKFSSNITRVVTVKDSVVEDPGFEASLTIKRKGSYQIRVDWYQNALPGFVTGLRVLDEAGDQVFSIAGGLLSCDSAPIELEPGKYRFTFECLGSGEDYERYAGEYLTDGEKGGVDNGFFRDGTWTMKYYISMELVASSLYKKCIMAAGVIIGLLLVAAMYTISRKADASVKKYDERQRIQQGMAAQASFATMLVYFFAVVFLEAGGVKLPLENGLVVFTGIMVSLAVHVAYSIMNDAYFRTDENKTVIILFDAVLFVVNAVIAVLNIVTGKWIVDGKASLTGNINLVCGIVFLCIFVVLFIKKRRDEKEALDEEP